VSETELPAHMVLSAVQVTEAAAIASWSMVGRGDEMEADRAAVEAMREALNGLDLQGRVVIGEGERGEAPMLFIGEALGKGKGPKIDIAVAPLEGATLAAKARDNALSVMAWSPQGGLLHAPDTYMDKIAIGPGFPAGLIDLDRTPAENACAVAGAKGVRPEAITACVLDRPRHADIIASLRTVGVRVLLITDGDVAGVINTTDPSTGIDLYIGQGGAPEGVLACAALKCVGGQFQGRLVFRNADERARAKRWGVKEPDRKYDLHEIVRGDAIFAATGLTNSALLDGVRIEGGQIKTHSLVMHSSTRMVREVRNKRPA
jgi:fructose-1,6-bisphosphatase II / sedoheptulose-1,7-bisphosphatase